MECLRLALIIWCCLLQAAANSVRSAPEAGVGRQNRRAAGASTSERQENEGTQETVSYEAALAELQGSLRWPTSLETPEPSSGALADSRAAVENQPTQNGGLAPCAGA